MHLALRRGSHNDAEACGHIIYDAFKVLADNHKFPPDFPASDIWLQYTTRKTAPSINVKR